MMNKLREISLDIVDGFLQFLSEARYGLTLNLLGWGSVVIGAFFWWINTPLQGHLHGSTLPILGPFSLSDAVHNPLRLTSYGVVLLCVTLLGLLAAARGSWARWAPLLGTCVLLMTVLIVGDVIFLHGEKVERLSRQTAEGVNLKEFDVTYLSGTVRALAVSKKATTDTLSDRLSTGLHALGGGWYFTVFGALLIYGSALRPGDWRLPLRRILTGLAAVALFLVVTALPSLIGEGYRLLGDKLLYQGESRSALAMYERAGRISPAFLENDEFMHQRGAAAYQAGLKNSPEALLYLGDNHITQGEALEATRNYARAAVLAPSWKILQYKEAEARVSLGLGYYAQGIGGAAVAQWEEAWKLAGDSVEIPFYLVKVYLDMDRRDQTRSVTMAQYVLSYCSDQLVRADTYNLMGDAYYKSEDYLHAREMYNLSWVQYNLVKKVINYDSMKGLQGL